ncbi:hypothetical protein ACN9MB_17465 [Dyella kyungheensis]|uniref:hypothetical protein n=1 Tax=Dyella kyungheensis TaxID=1242174 RepID=UPI003CE86234
MLPNEFLDVKNDLQKSILNFYKNLGRDAVCFRESKNEEWGGEYLHFLIDKTKVIRYGFAHDREMWVGGVQLGIGPEYFSPAYFWSYENSTRFISDIDTQSVFHNLFLMDEFWQRNG